jgi:hypothetical protein
LKGEALMRKIKITWLLLGVFLIFTSHSVLALNPEDFPDIVTYDDLIPVEGNFIDIFITPAGSFELTDPKGRRLGFDLATKKTLEEMPFSCADVEAMYDPETDIQEVPPSWRIMVLRLMEGNYCLKIFNIPDKKYDLTVRNEENRKDLLEIPITKKSIHIFDIQIDKKGNFTIIRKK